MIEYTEKYKKMYTEEEWFSSVHDQFERNTISNTQIYRDKILNKLKKHFGNKFFVNPFSILDIGGGNGKRTLLILNQILKIKNKVRIDYNDFSKIQYNKFKKLFEENNFRNNIGEIFIGDFDKLNFDKKYDFILCIHTLYGVSSWKTFDNDKNSLVKIKNLLKPNSLACIIIRDKNNISYFIHNKFKDYIGISDPTICAEKIFKVLAKFNIKFNFDEAHSIIPPLKLFDNNSLSDVSKNFISYYMHKKFDEIKEEYTRIISDETQRRKNNFEIDSSKIIWIYS